MRRTAQTYAGPQATLAVALLRDGEAAGSIVAAYGAGSVTATVTLFGDHVRLLQHRKATGHARGVGYCRASTAIAEALQQLGEADATFGGKGLSAVFDWFRLHGYDVFQVC